MCTFQAGDHVNVENYEGGIKILHRSRSMIGMSWNQDENKPGVVAPPLRGWVGGW